MSYINLDNCFFPNSIKILIHEVEVMIFINKKCGENK